MSDGLTTEQLRAGIASLEGALASGALSGSYAGRSWTYRTVPELKDALAYMRQRLIELSGTPRRNVSYIQRIL